MMGPGFGSLPDYMTWMMLGAYVFWALLAVLGLYVVVRLVRPADQRRDAKSILDERLARGEIDADEYRSRLAVLRF